MRSGATSEVPAHVSTDEFRRAMRQLAGGVTIVAAGTGEGRRGLTVSAVCSVSIDPSTLLVCIGQSTEGHRAILETEAFSVNVLGWEQKALAERFAGRDGVAGRERFATGNWHELVTGSPVLVDALAAFDCRVAHKINWMTHTVFLGTVVAVRAAASPAPEPTGLVYRVGAFAAA